MPQEMTNITKADLRKNLKKFFGFDEFKGKQEEIIMSLLQGHDTFVIMPTGGGKSLCYQLPALLLDGVAIVISPLIALMKNQVDLIRGYSQDDNVAHFLNSSLNKSQKTQVKEDLQSGKTKLLYIAPETMTKDENIEFLSSLNISFIAVDEAHCISEWGHDFRPEYRRIKEVVERIDGKLPIISLTATATPKVQDDIKKNLGLDNLNLFVSSFNRTNLFYEIVPKGNKQQTIKSIVKFISKHKGKSGIIYVLNRKSTEELAEILQANNIKAVPYHAGMDAATRALRQDQYLNEDVDVIVATIAFGMGIDKPDVRFVIHYNLPKSLENYYQETGRAGRDGLEGKCVLYYSHKDLQKLEHLLKDKPLTEREMNTQLINETVYYIESGVCRRRTILHYFGEEYPNENCGLCDNCMNPKEKLEVKDSSKIVLQCVKELNEQFNIEYVVKVLQGQTNSQIQTFKHHKLKTFGSGQIMEMDDNFWFSLIRQMMLEGLLRKDIENYGLIKITEKGHAFLNKPFSIMVSLNHEYNTDDDNDMDEIETGSSSGGALDENLLSILKTLRRDEAHKHNLPPYILFSENALEDMATFFPTTLKELEKCQGVNTGKAKKYGKPFIEFLSNYVEENEIEKPDDFVMKNVADKSTIKVFIIQNLDKQIPLEDIASIKNLSIEELLDEMETIVMSGTKLNIDYVIEEYLDEYAQEDISQYLSESESGDINEVVEILSDEGYSYEEVQLMKIKFMCDHS